ncbi:hypothetical protein M5D96_004899, partial [Drosophila gunungcola]
MFANKMLKKFFILHLFSFERKLLCASFSSSSLSFFLLCLSFGFNFML